MNTQVKELVNKREFCAGLNVPEQLIEPKVAPVNIVTVTSLHGP